MEIGDAVEINIGGKWRSAKVAGFAPDNFIVAELGDEHAEEWPDHHHHEDGRRKQLTVAPRLYRIPTGNK